MDLLTPSKDLLKLGKAAFALNAAATIVFGNHQFSGRGFPGMSVGQDFLIFNLLKYLPLLNKMGHNITTEDQAIDILCNMNLPEQMTFCRKVMSEIVTGAQIRQIVITDAFTDVFGEPPAPQVFAELDAQIINGKVVTYTTMKYTNTQLLKKDAKIARAVVDRAYWWGMGRNANESDASYWVPLRPTYPVIRGAQIPWLYSDSGIKDLVETIDRAFQTVKKKKPTASEANTFLSTAKQYNLPYADMLGRIS